MPNPAPAPTPWGGNKGLIYMEVAHGLNNSVLSLQKKRETSQEQGHPRSTLPATGARNQVSVKKPVVAWGRDGREREEQAPRPEQAASAHTG